MGRPTKYKDEYCEKLIEYFDIEPYVKEKVLYYYKNGDSKEQIQEVPNDLPLLSKFAASINVSRDTLHEWAHGIDRDGNLKHPEFSDAYKKAKELQRAVLITNGLRGNYQTAFAIFTAKNLTDMRDKQEIEHSGSIKQEVEESILDEKIDKLLKLRELEKNQEVTKHLKE
jgi:hypothetical protein